MLLHRVVLFWRRRSGEVRLISTRSGATKHYCAAVCVIVFLFSTTAQALDNGFRRSSDNTIDFSLIVGQSEYTLEEEQEHIDVKIRRLGVDAYDVPASGVEFGVQLGYAFASVDNQDATEGLDSDGAYAGFLVRVFLFQREKLSLFVNGRYTYIDVDGKQSGQRMSLHWNQFDVSLNLALRLTERTELLAAANYGIIDATEQLSGPVHQTLDLDNESRSGIIAAVRYWVAEDQSVAFYGSSGYAEGFHLQFQRFFY